MKGCPFITKEIPAYVGNYTKNRARYGKISEITVHHAAGIVSVDALGRLWQKKGRAGSSHYGVSGAQIGQYVSEDDVAWTNSNWSANCRAVTIEVSNSSGAPNWEVSDTSLQTLVKLVADIARRNGLFPLAVGKTLTYHSMYTATACPGPYLKSKLQWLCDEANKLCLPVQTAAGMYIVQAGFFEKEGNANAFHVELGKKGVESVVVPVDGGFRVQCGAFTKKENAQALVQQLAAKGVQTVLKEV